MSTFGGSTSKGGAVAAAWAHADAWRLVALAPGPTPRIIAAESIPLRDGATLAQARERLGIARLVAVAPAASCVSKTAGVPAGSDEEVAAALALMSEAELPGSLPAHRCAGGRLPGRAPSGVQPALLIGLTTPPSAPPPAVDAWTGEPAALAFLVTSPGAAVVADRLAGSIATVARSPEGWMIRGFRAPADDPREWADELTDAARAAASHAATESPTPPATDTWVWLDPASREALRSRVAGVSLDEQWLARFAVPLGAALGAITASPPSRPLFDLRIDPPRQRRPLLARGAAWLADPVHAVALTLVSAVLAAAAPLTAALIEREALRNRVATIEAAIESEGGQGWLDADRRAALYEALQHDRWPMTKLTADLARALPVGADIEFLELKTGDAIMIRGNADSLELVNTLAETLNRSAVFRDFVTNNAQVRAEPGAARPIEFELRGYVARPYAAAEGVDDFADNPLAVRMYGERGRLVVGRASKQPPPNEPDTTDVQADPDIAAATDPPTETASADSPDAADRRSIFDRGQEEPADKQDPVPEPLTDEALAALTEDQARNEWISRQSYAKTYRASLAPEVVERLEQESQRAKERFLELKRGG